MDTNKTRQTINFDLCYSKYKEKYGKSKADDLYKQFKRYFEKNNFERVGETSYTSTGEINYFKTIDMIAEIHDAISNLKYAVNNQDKNNYIKSFHLTTVIGDVYDVKNFAMKNHTITMSDIKDNPKLLFIDNLNISDTTPHRRSIRFDMDESKFKELNPDKSYSRAYEEIGNKLKLLGYEWKQNSVYVSPSKKTNEDVIKDILEITNSYPTYIDAFNLFQTSAIENLHDFTKVANLGYLKNIENTNESVYYNPENEAKVTVKIEYDNKLLQDRLDKYGVNAEIEEVKTFTENYMKSNGYSKNDDGSFSKENSSEEEVKNDINKLTSNFEYLAESFKTVKIIDGTNEKDITDIANNKNNVKTKENSKDKENIVNKDNARTLGDD